MPSNRDAPLAPASDTLAVIPGLDWGHLVIQVAHRLAIVIDMGGPVILALGVLSVAALAIVLLKLWQFGRLRLGALGPVQDALTLWRRHEDEAALARLRRMRSPVARVVAVAMVGLERPDVEPALLREELVRLASVELEGLRSYLRTLEVIGTLSPLLGLLGTVLGMIEAFRRLESAGTQVDPAILSGGIWQALLTTAVGLSIAIPVVLAHTWLERRVERCGHQMEDAVTQVFTRDLLPIDLEVGPGHQSAATDAAQVSDAA
ncbi:MotA/TolQ/ExbB proton channel family protein [Thermochromatium tepidum ATCC 43061]|uniref:MotA/TolQ/ExbB proton channel family protein n=2 Tax=Thermochromatium tepidum TaxID=1050 RepID=A0A6I6DXF8_THETI|nr:MotA/TolQ/ExbB proton channel family protein [Thermochromatium tepidum ATCC 43061]